MESSGSFSSGFLLLSLAAESGVRTRGRGRKHIGGISAGGGGG